MLRKPFQILAIRFHRIPGEALFNTAKIEKRLDPRFYQRYFEHRANDTIFAKMFGRKSGLRG